MSATKNTVYLCTHCFFVGVTDGDYFQLLGKDGIRVGQSIFAAARFFTPDAAKKFAAKHGGKVFEPEFSITERQDQ